MAAMLHLLGADSATLSFWPAVTAMIPADAASLACPDYPGWLLQFAQRLACAGQVQASVFQFTENVENQVDV